MLGVVAIDGKAVARPLTLPSTPPENSALCGVHYSSINRLDTLQRAGLMPPPPGASNVLGLDFSGSVITVSSPCSKFKPGDRVAGLVSSGGNASRVYCLESHMFVVPPSIPMNLAAGIPENWITAWQLVSTVANLKQNTSVLIHAGGSGVGLALIQICNLHFNCSKIIATGSRSKHELCLSFGATEYFDRNDEPKDRPFVAYGDGGVDVVFDCVGGPYFERNLAAINVDGQLIFYGLLAGFETTNPMFLRTLLLKRISIRPTTLRSRSDDYKAKLISSFTESVLPMIANGQYMITLDEQFDLVDAQLAHDRMEANLNVGKILLLVREEDHKVGLGGGGGGGASENRGEGGCNDVDLTTANNGVVGSPFAHDAASAVSMQTPIFALPSNPNLKISSNDATTLQNELKLANFTNKISRNSTTMVKKFPKTHSTRRFFDANCFFEAASGEAVANSNDNQLASLFLFGQRVPIGDISQTLLTLLLRMNIVITIGETHIVSLYMLYPIDLDDFGLQQGGNNYFLTDWPVIVLDNGNLANENERNERARNAVMPIGYDTLELLSTISAIKKREGGNLHVVDMCTGCGVQGICAASMLGQGGKSKSEGTISVSLRDINPRCIEFAAFNSKLNNNHDENEINFYHSDVFNGKHSDIEIDMEIDLLLVNPPFVATPKKITESSANFNPLYADGGVDGNVVIERIFAELPGRLKSGENGGLGCFMVTEVPNVEDSPTMVAAMMGGGGGTKEMKKTKKIRIVYCGDDVETAEEYGEARALEREGDFNAEEWDCQGVWNRALVVGRFEIWDEGEDLLRTFVHVCGEGKEEEEEEGEVEAIDEEDNLLTKKAVGFLRCSLLDLRDGIEAVVFDLDGTILDTSQELMEAVCAAANVVNGTKVHSFESVVAMNLVGAPLDEIYEKLVCNPETNRSERYKLFVNEFLKVVHNSPKSDKFDDVGEWQEKGGFHSDLKLAIATTKPTTTAKDDLSAVGLLHLFTFVQGTDEGMRAKPAPDCIEFCLKQLNVSAKNAIYVGDTERDIVAANEAGCRRAVLIDRKHNNTDNKFGADVVIKVFTELEEKLKSSLFAVNH